MYTDEKFGTPGSAHINPIEWDEHAEIGGIGRKKVTIVGSDGSVADVTTTGKLKVDATVTATIDPTGLATDSNQTNGNQVTKVKETAPTDSTKTNPSLALSYDANGNLTGMSMTIGATTYNKTLTWTSGNLTNISSWS